MEKEKDMNKVILQFPGQVKIGQEVKIETDETQYVCRVIGFIASPTETGKKECCSYGSGIY